MNGGIFPFDLGPLNPTAWGLVVGVVSFALVYLVLSQRLLPRASRVIAERERMTQGVTEQAEEVRTEAEEVRARREAILAEARHEAARTRQAATEKGMELITAARAEGMRERERILADGAAAIEAERIVAEAALRSDVDAWARALAERVVGEPLPAPQDAPRRND
ncbi:F0F1 ATP synthase subunit B family protein [Streptomyces sp. NPDC004838]